MAKRGRPKGKMNKGMAEKKRRARLLFEANPTLSMARVARHVEVSDTTVSKWYDEWALKRWFCGTH